MVLRRGYERFEIHFAVANVGCAVYLTVLFTGGVFAMSGLADGKVVAFAIAPAITALVCWRFARRLLRLAPDWWSALTIACTLAPPATGIGVLVAAEVLLHSFELDGPPSRDGHTVTIEVRDAGLGPVRDVYADVLVCDPAGAIVVEWRDPHGWGRRDGPFELRDSMRWTNERELTFTGRGGPVTLELP